MPLGFAFAKATGMRCEAWTWSAPEWQGNSEEPSCAKLLMLNQAWMEMQCEPELGYSYTQDVALFADFCPDVQGRDVTLVTSHISPFYFPTRGLLQPTPFSAV